MGRIFSIISAISALMILLAGGGAYWLSSAKISSSERAAIVGTANGMATAITLQMETIQQSVDALGRLPDVIEALSSGNSEQIAATASKLQTIIPGALRIRLLLPGISEPEQTAAPHMGYGDLEMAHSTLTAKQKAVIQGEGEHRHLAFTSAVTQDNRVIGVVLASFKADLVKQAVAKTKFDAGYTEIIQDQTVLASNGNPEAKYGDPEIMPLGDSRWVMHLWTNSGSSLADIGLVVSIILIPTLLACYAFIQGYRKLVHHLQQDQSSIVQAAKDMMVGKHSGNYPVLLDEMRPIITTLAQYKRVMNQEAVHPVENTEHDFFDTSFNFDVLNEPEETDDWPEADIAGSAPTASLDAVPADFDMTESAPVPAPTPYAPPKKIDSANKPPVSSPVKQHQPAGSIFREYDIRGIVGKDLNEEIVANIGKAVASEAQLLGIKTIVMARDGRLSSPNLAQALANGLTAIGCDVMDIGLTPTPMLYFVAHHTEGRSGVMITGSHNPADYNGLKIVLNGETLSGERIQGIKKRIDSGDYGVGMAGTVTQNNSFTNEYIGIISEDIRIARPMKVVVDCGNGATSTLGPVLLKTVGCEVIDLYCTIDGNFPNHHPDPSKPENMADLAAIVKLHAADLGIAFDGDGDRLGVVDSQGKIIWPDRQMMVFARDVLARKPGADIIYDVKCSKHLHEQIAKRGGRPIMWKSGHSLMKAKLKETGAALAGEMSGHIFFNDRWFGFDDALYAAARMIQILSEDTRSSQEVFAELPDSINTPELNIALKEGENTGFIERMFSLANFKDAKIIDIDGMRVEFADGWGLIRASNTTPSLVLRFEADNKEALQRIQTEFKKLMLQIKSDISLPF